MHKIDTVPAPAKPGFLSNGQKINKKEIRITQVMLMLSRGNLGAERVGVGFFSKRGHGRPLRGGDI